MVRRCPIRLAIVSGPMGDTGSPSQIMSNRICREDGVLRLRGCPASWMP